MKKKNFQIVTLIFFIFYLGIFLFFVHITNF